MSLPCLSLWRRTSTLFLYVSLVDAKFPVRSWETIPAFFHSSEHVTRANDGGFDQAALAIIEKFPMVTIEKWQGDGVQPRISEEQAWAVAARQVKARNPRATVVVWLDSLRISMPRAMSPTSTLFCPSFLRSLPLRPRLLVGFPLRWSLPSRRLRPLPRRS